mgnify:CR=1 FL=1
MREGGPEQPSGLSVGEARTTPRCVVLEGALVEEKSYQAYGKEIKESQAPEHRDYFSVKAFELGLSHEGRGFAWARSGRAHSPK